MLGKTFTVLVHLHGTLAANALGNFRMPCDAVLREVSAVASNNSDARIIVGTAADDNGYCTDQVIGDSGTPAVLTQTGALITPASGATLIADDTNILWTLDFDGAGGTAGQNVSILFTFEA